MISMSKREYRQLKRRFGDRRQIDWPVITEVVVCLAFWSLMIWWLL